MKIQFKYTIFAIITLLISTKMIQCTKHPIKLIIDTDGVHDDMRALTIALRSPDVEVLAITTVHGGVSVEQATANVARLLRATMKTDVPIYMGAGDSIIPKGPIVVWDTVFGFDGIGGVPNAFPKSLPSDESVAENKTAVDALIDLINANDDVVLVCIGPLTNIAKAIQKDHLILDKIKKIVIMGGNYLGIGNSLTNSTAEFNFQMDPEAAQIVLSSVEATIVPWDTCFLKGPEYRNLVDYEESLKQKTPLSNFLSNITARVRKWSNENNQQYAFIDDIAMSIAIYPRVATKVLKMNADVELATNSYTRGQVVLDWMSVHYNERSEQYEALRCPNENGWLTQRFVTDYNVREVNDLLVAAVRSTVQGNSDFDNF